MAATGKVYGLHARDQWGGTAGDRIDYLGDTLKGTLHTVTYAVSQDADDYFTDATNELASSGGYTAGGVTFAGKTLTYDGPTNTVRFKANDVLWTALDPSAAFRYFVARKDTGVAATSHLMFYVDMGADQDPNGIDFAVKGDATDGFMRAVVS
jgi:hypothetical protein